LAAALIHDPEVLILDEPTAVLGEHEASKLLQLLRRLRDEGRAVLFISHHLDEVVAVADRVSVLRDGRLVARFQRNTAGVLQAEDGTVATEDTLAQAMVGRELGSIYPPKGSAKPGAIAAIELIGFGAAGRSRDVSVTVSPGEIVGIAGVAGNGQSELLELLSGMLKPQAGRLRLGASTLDATDWLDPSMARRLRLAHVPEDRHRFGVVLPFATWENAVLGYQRSRRFASAWGWVRRKVARTATATMLETYDVRPPQADLRTSKFSGGNQQKLVLAREALAPEQPPQVLLVGQPTRGVDIGAIEFIHGRLRAMRDARGAVLLVSSELDEILALSDRVLVMNQGAIVGELAIEDCTESALGRLMAGVSADRVAPRQTFAREIPG
jgi:simple sugar transport system ATP-binding protein